MFDLALTNKGDLMFVNNENRNKPISIKFNVTTGHAVKISYLIEDSIPLSAGENSIKISFNMDPYKNNKQALLYYDNDAKAQAIKFRLQTSITDILGRPTIGSYLELIKHKSFADSTLKNKVITIVTDAIKDILPNASVDVRTFAGKTIGSYSQKLIIYIYNRDVLIFKYEIKG